MTARFHHYADSGKLMHIKMESKVWRDGRPDPLAMELQQLDDSMSVLSQVGVGSHVH